MNAGTHHFVNLPGVQAGAHHFANISGIHAAAHYLTNTQAALNDNMVTQIIKPFGSPLHTRQGHQDQAHLIQSALLLIMHIASNCPLSCT